MAYASKAGRAYASASNPRAFAVCDRCGIWTFHHKLAFQFDWAGPSMVNKRLLVCGPCMDRPQQQLRAIVLPADPVPIDNPRPELQNGQTVRFTNYEFTTDPFTDMIIAPLGEYRATQVNALRVLQQTGEPPGGLNETPGVPPVLPPDQEVGLPPGNDEVPETGPLE